MWSQNGARMPSLRDMLLVLGGFVAVLLVYSASLVLGSRGQHRWSGTSPHHTHGIPNDSISPSHLVRPATATGSGSNSGGGAAVGVSGKAGYTGGLSQSAAANSRDPADRQADDAGVTTPFGEAVQRDGAGGVAETGTGADTRDSSQHGGSREAGTAIEGGDGEQPPPEPPVADGGQENDSAVPSLPLVSQRCPAPTQTERAVDVSKMKRSQWLPPKEKAFRHAQCLATKPAAPLCWCPGSEDTQRLEKMLAKKPKSLFSLKVGNSPKYGLLFKDGTRALWKPGPDGLAEYVAVHTPCCMATAPPVAGASDCLVDHRVWLHLCVQVPVVQGGASPRILSRSTGGAHGSQAWH